MKKSLLVFGIILLAFESSFAQLRPINERREVERVEKKEQGSEKKFFKRILNTESKDSKMRNNEENMYVIKLMICIFAEY